MDKINQKIFSFLWQKIQNGACLGTDIVSKQDVGLASDYDIPVIWLHNNRLGAKIMAFLITSGGQTKEFTYLSYQGQKDQANRIIDRKFFGRIRGGKYATSFIFPPEALVAFNRGNVKAALSSIDQRIAELKKTATDDFVLECIKSRPYRKTNVSTKIFEATFKSVRTISGGLYGLGKNRKH